MAGQYLIQQGWVTVQSADRNMISLGSRVGIRKTKPCDISSFTHCGGRMVRVLPASQVGLCFYLGCSKMTVKWIAWNMKTRTVPIWYTEVILPTLSHNANSRPQPDVCSINAKSQIPLVTNINNALIYTPNQINHTETPPNANINVMNHYPQRRFHPFASAFSKTLSPFALLLWRYSLNSPWCLLRGFPHLSFGRIAFVKYFG